jgi:hypothetical protein
MSHVYGSAPLPTQFQCRYFNHELESVPAGMLEAAADACPQLDHLAE